MRRAALAVVVVALALTGVVDDIWAEETLAVLGDSLTAGFGVGP